MSSFIILFTIRSRYSFGNFFEPRTAPFLHMLDDVSFKNIVASSTDSTSLSNARSRPGTLKWGILSSDRATGLILLTRSEEHTSELQSRGLISYAVFCLKKKH